jgi:hypothetical protein
MVSRGTHDREDDNRFARVRGPSPTLSIVIASASEAIQSFHEKILDCFVAFAPRNDGIYAPPVMRGFGPRIHVLLFLYSR